MGTFALDISKFVKRAPDKAQQIVKKVCFDIYDNIKMRTPWDTGQARNGWMITEGATVTRIFNNVEYIVPLEYGHSKKNAPHGMVRITLCEYQAYLKKHVATL